MDTVPDPEVHFPVLTTYVYPLLVSQFTRVQPGEILPIDLQALDQVNNSREAVWSLESPESMTVSFSTWQGAQFTQSSYGLEAKPHLLQQSWLH